MTSAPKHERKIYIHYSERAREYLFNAPTHALIALRTPDDARTWGTTRDPGL